VIIGRLEPAKAHHIFLKALKEVINSIQNFKALIIGDGSLKQEIIFLTKELNLQHNVILTGLRKDIPELLSMADLFVLSSTREGFPITLLEAMSCRDPVCSNKRWRQFRIMYRWHNRHYRLPRTIQKLLLKPLLHY